MRKSRILQLLLTIFFGPLGLFYTSTAAAIVCLLISIVVALASGGFGLILMWPVVVLVGMGTVLQYNARVGLERRRHEELLEALHRASPSVPSPPKPPARRLSLDEAVFYIVCLGVAVMVLIALVRQA